MRIALAQHFTRVLPIFLLSIMLSACTIDSSAIAQDPPADPPDPPALSHVAPVDSSPGQLDATLTVVDDQDASDKKVQLGMYFATRVLLNQNTVEFGAGEMIRCNNVQLAYTSTTEHPDLYMANLPLNGVYTCTYNSHGTPATMTIDAEPRLSLHMTVSGNSFTVTYHPGVVGSCHIRVTPEQDFSGIASPWVNDTGSYTGTGVNTLSGKGDLLLERSCSYPYQGTAFHSITVTYDSLASLQVTWNGA